MDDILNVILGELNKVAGDAWLFILMIFVMQIIFGVTLVVIMNKCIKSLSKAHDAALSRATEFSQNVTNAVIEAYKHRDPGDKTREVEYSQKS